MSRLRYSEIVPLDKDGYTEPESEALMAEIDRMKKEMWILGYKFEDVKKSGEYEMTLTFIPCDCEVHREERANPN